MDTVQMLEWDSTFVGIPVARWIPSALNNALLDQDFLRLLEQGVQLCYLFAPQSVEWTHPQIAHKVLANHKRIYRRKLHASDPASAEPLTLFDASTDPQPLFDLALICGTSSRFALDPQFPQTQFESMYHLWMEQSLTGKMADVILIIHHQNQLAGMITLQKKEQACIVRLFAVDPRFHGLGLGRRLLQQAYAWGWQNGCEYFEAGTQAESAAACKTYEATGNQLIQEEWVYHLWIDAPSHAPTQS